MEPRLSCGASIYVNIILGLGVRDYTAASCATAAKPGSHQPGRRAVVGHAQIEMKLRAKRNGYQVKEVPITFVDRELGTSKVSMNIREAPRRHRHAVPTIFFLPAMSTTLFQRGHVVTDKSRSRTAVVGDTIRAKGQPSRIEDRDSRRPKRPSRDCKGCG